MFDKHEVLTCKECGDSFMGRQPAEGGTPFCTKCWDAQKLSPINEGDDIPETVNAEFEIGGGENG